MTTTNGLKKAMNTLSLMKFFPSDTGTREALIELLSEMCETDEQAIWLAKRTTQLHSEWPGALELRAVLCSKVTPADGIDAYSMKYPEGIPSEKESRLALNAGTTAPCALLPAGHVASVDPEAERLLVEAVQASALPALPKYRARGANERRVDEELRALLHLPAKETAAK